MSHTPLKLDKVNVFLVLNVYSFWKKGRVIHTKRVEGSKHTIVFDCTPAEDVEFI